MELIGSWGAEQGPTEKPSQSKSHAHSAKGIRFSCFLYEHQCMTDGDTFRGAWNTAVTSNQASPGLEPQAEIPQQSLLATI